MNFLRNTKTETTQQRVWCSTGIRYTHWCESLQCGYTEVQLFCINLMSLHVHWQDYVDAPLTIPVCFTQNLNIDWTQYQVTSPLFPSVFEFLHSVVLSFTHLTHSFSLFYLWCISAICCPNCKVLWSWVITIALHTYSNSYSVVSTSVTHAVCPNIIQPHRTFILEFKHMNM